MRAMRLAQLGGLPELVEVDPPSRAGGQALVAISAVALNPVDLAIASGRFYGGSPQTPYVPGAEGVGRVLEADSLPAGTRVYLNGDGLGIRRDGALAEQAIIAEQLAIPLPDEIEDPLAVACGIAGLAGWIPVSWRARVRDQDRVLVLGATGTVGLVAVQAARLLGASRVVAAGRRPERLERAKEVGADAAVELDGGEALARAFVDAFGGEGPTVIIDPLWGPPLVAALQAAANGVRVVQIGQSAGAEATIPSNFVRGKQAEIFGYSNYTVPRDVFRASYLELVGHAAAGRVRIELETYPLERAREAWERQAAGPGTKLVVTL